MKVVDSCGVRIVTFDILEKIFPDTQPNKTKRKTNKQNHL